jgi:uncharacterized RDD family membrane protein YckC
MLPPTAPESSMSSFPDAQPATPAGLFRRFAAGFYDGLLLLAMSLVAVALVLAVSGGFHQPVGVLRKSTPPETAANVLAVVACTVLYFGHGWRKAGQSLGMKAWKIRVERLDGSLPSWSAALLRLACAAPFYLALLVGVLAAMLHRYGLAAGMALPMILNAVWLLWRGEGTLHDRWSRTRVVRET